jgi:hypothetical protein
MCDVTQDPKGRIGRSTRRVKSKAAHFFIILRTFYEAEYTMNSCLLFVI